MDLIAPEQSGVTQFFPGSLKNYARTKLKIQHDYKLIMFLPVLPVYNFPVLQLNNLFFILNSISSEFHDHVYIYNFCLKKSRPKTFIQEIHELAFRLNGV